LVPKIVDHERRRREVVSAAWRVINRVGLENATVREIAREAKSSTGAIAHYFASKDDILRAALERADEDIRRRIEAMSDDFHPLTRLRAALREALPLDRRRTFELTLDVNFWARALNHTSLRALQHRDHNEWRDGLLEFVTEVQAGGWLDQSLPADELTDVLVAFVDGLGVQGLVYPELLTKERIGRLLDAQLVALGADARYLVDMPSKRAVQHVEPASA
jgi:AcrR family transcriptional regulator